MSGAGETTLAQSRSPFLRHGAEQPVRWMEWGDAAFERARRDDRPILLDIGAVWCHWCHVMDHESYDDAETAELINELFVPVKVDRDERPDVDARYQRAVQALTGQGGWPLTAFLTPDGEPFYAGTYYPPEDRFGRPSFRKVLREVARVWTESRDRAEEAARTVRARLSAYEEAEVEAGAVPAGIAEQAVEEFAQAFDFRHGGFGGSPKFPNAGAVCLLLDGYLESGTDWMRRIVVETLDGMARGGIHDQLGGGFHRYTTDAHWRIPHFEKMAYDNGVLLDAYARAHAALGRPLHRQAAEAIVAYYRDVAAELLEAGGFPASQDADIGPHDDGDYWTWTLDEVRDALDGDERAVRAAVLRYGLDDPASAMPTDRSRHVPYRALEPEDLAARLEIGVAEAEALAADVAGRLKAARDRRPRPYVDETVYGGWTALVAAGHLAAGRYLGLEDATATALRALDRVLEEAYAPGAGVAHRLGDPPGAGYLDDQAAVAAALLDAFEITQREPYLTRAGELADAMLDRFGEPAGGALRDRPRDAAETAAPLAEPQRPIVDSPAPSGNAMAAMTLLRLSALGAGERYRERALGILRAFGGSAPRIATSAATYVRAVQWAVAPVSTVVVVGAEADGGAASLMEVALRTYRPRTVVRRFEPGAVQPEAVPPELRAMVTGQAPRAYLCAGQTCAPPVDRPDALADRLRTFRG